MMAACEQVAAPHQIVNRCRCRATAVREHGVAGASAGHSRRFRCESVPQAPAAVAEQRHGVAPGRLSSTSAAVSTRMAPWRIRSLPPRARGSSGRARHGEHLPPGLLREPRGDQAAGPQRRLHHHDAQRQPGDDAVAPGKMPRLRDRAERRLGHHQAPISAMRALQGGVLGRVGLVQAAGDHRDGAAGAHRAACGRRCRCRAPGRTPPDQACARSAASVSAMRCPLAEALRPPTSATAAGLRQRRGRPRRSGRAARPPASPAAAGSRRRQETPSGRRRVVVASISCAASDADGVHAGGTGASAGPGEARQGVQRRGG